MSPSFEAKSEAIDASSVLLKALIPTLLLAGGSVKEAILQ